MEKNASLWAYVTGLSTAGAAWMTLERVALLVGIVTALGTFCVNWYYKAREHRLKERKYGLDS